MTSDLTKLQVVYRRRRGSSGMAMIRGVYMGEPALGSLIFSAVSSLIPDFVWVTFLIIVCACFIEHNSGIRGYLNH